MALLNTAVRNKEGKKKSTRFFSKKQETQVAEALDGKRTPNSGATKFSKSDVLVDQFTIECKTKTTTSDSLSIKKDWIEKQKQESLFMGKPYWTIAFNFGPNEENYYIINEELMEYLMNCLSGDFR